MTIRIAGPHSSGTNDDPGLMKTNFRKLESVALQLFRSGHIPVIGEWIAWPVSELTGLISPVAGAYRERLFPLAQCPLSKCDAILCLGEVSELTDELVNNAKEKGLKIYDRIDDIGETIHAGIFL